jgi:hypothetical protein
MFIPFLFVDFCHTCPISHFIYPHATAVYIAFCHVLQPVSESRLPYHVLNDVIPWTL